MRRREFVWGTLAAGALPLVSSAQQSGRMRRLSVLMDRPEETDVLERIAALRHRLAELGWKDGDNLGIELFGGGDMETRQALARQIVASTPDVLVVIGNPGLAALQRQTRTVPIVFVQVGDPVGSGFVKSLARPGGNTTGFMHFERSMGGKWLEVLKEIAPRVTHVTMLLLPEVAANVEFVRAAQEASTTYKVTVSAAGVHNEDEIKKAIVDAASQPNGGLIVLPNPVTGRHRELIADLATHRLLPSVAAFRYMAASGALASYGVHVLELYRNTAAYVHRILNGENPAVLPVQAPTKFELVLNLKTAKKLGLEIPPTLLARADEVVE